VLVWRVCARAYAEEAFSGKGAAREGGRWNPPGLAVVYTSESLSLAALEFFAGLQMEDLALALVSIRAEIPDGLKVHTLEAKDLPAEWRAYPAPASVQRLGTEWISRGESAVLSAPSTVIVVERNYLLNPRHSEFRRIVIQKPEPFELDPRMWKRRR